MFSTMFSGKRGSKDAEKILKVKEVLFPAPIRKTDGDGNVYILDSSTIANLEAVICDIEDGHCDETVKHTLRNILQQLEEVRGLLNSYHQIDFEGVKYLVVDNETDEDIQNGTVVLNDPNRAK